MNMVNFDKNKYPLDHEFENNSSLYYVNYGKFYEIGYDILCKKCNLFIRHEEVIREQTVDFLNDCFYAEIDNKLLFHYVNRDIFTFSKVLSCAEVMIKKLLE